MRLLASLALAAMLVVGGGERSEAAFVSCSNINPAPAGTAGYQPYPTNALKANVGCEGSSSTSFTQPQNLDIFGKTGWLQIAKLESTSPGSPANLDTAGVTFKSTSVTGNFSGTWSVAQSVYDNYSYVAIVMNDGNHNPHPTIAYLVTALGGTWITPWVHRIHDTLENSLSNVQFVGIRGETTVIPLPAAGWLILAGLGGLGLVARRRSRAA
jgi:hypothetical protein